MTLDATTPFQVWTGGAPELVRLDDIATWLASNQPLAHPLAGDIHTIYASDYIRPWAGALWHSGDAEDRLFLTYTTNIVHGSTGAAPLIAAGNQLILTVSDDRGNSWNPHRSIWSADGFTVHHMAGGVMGLEGSVRRHGVLFSVFDGVEGERTVRFAYSDDAAHATWAVTDLSDLGTPLIIHGDLRPLPGHGDAGWFCLADVGTKIVQIYTEDNGDTFAVRDCFTPAGFNPEEPYAVSLDALRLITFMRTATADNVHASLSSDGGETWSDPVDTGVSLGSNPVYPVLANGKIALYLTAREENPIEGRENALLYVQEDAETVWANGGVFTRPVYRVAANLTNWGTGYWTGTVDLEGNRYTAGSVGELAGTTAGGTYSTTKGTGGSMVLISNVKRPVASPNLVKMLRPNRNLIRNGHFQHWTRGPGTYAFSGSSGVKTADSISVLPSTAVGEVSRIEVAEEVRRNLTHRPRYGLRWLTTTQDNFVNLFQRTYDPQIVMGVEDRPLTWQIWGEGTPPAAMYGQVNLNFGSGGSTAIFTQFPLGIVASGGIWYASKTLQCVTALGKTYGSSLYTGSPFAEFTLSTSNDVDEFDCNLFGWKVEFGDTPTVLEPPDLNAERAWLDRRVQRLVFDNAGDVIGVCYNSSTTVANLRLPFVPKDADREHPVVTHQAGPGATGVAADIEVIHGSGSTAAVSAVTIANITRDGCEVQLTTTGLTAGQASLARVKATSPSGPVSFLVDAEV